jgi:hypothetical protein
MIAGDAQAGNGDHADPGRIEVTVMSQSDARPTRPCRPTRAEVSGVAVKSIESLGRTYVFMALAAWVVISIDQTVMRTLISTTRIALDGTLGAAGGLAVLKLMGFARRLP